MGFTTSKRPTVKLAFQRERERERERLPKVTHNHVLIVTANNFNGLFSCQRFNEQCISYVMTDRWEKYESSKKY